MTERCIPSLNPTHSELEQYCRLFFQNEGSLEHYETLSGGAVNATFKIVWAGNSFVMRFYLRNPISMYLEKALYKRIESVVSIPKMLFTSDSERSFALFTFCDKPSISEVTSQSSSKLCYDMGKNLAKIHAIKFPMAGLFGKDLTTIDLVFKEGSSPYYEYC